MRVAVVGYRVVAQGRRRGSDILCNHILKSLRCHSHTTCGRFYIVRDYAIEHVC